MRYFMAPIRTVLLLLSIVSLSRAAELTSLDGKKLKGEIVAIEGSQLTFKATGTDQRYELTKLATVDLSDARPPAPGSKWIEVELVDGSHFRCSDFKIKNKSAILTLLGSARTIEISAATIFYMIRDISDPKLNQAFRGFLAKRGKRDLWIVSKGETLDAVPGTFGDGDDTGNSVNFEFEANNDKVSIQVSRVYGMIFNQPPGIQAAQTVCRVVDSQSNVLFAKAIDFKEKRPLVIETVMGVRVEYPTIDGIAKFDFSAGAMNYLSDLTPEKVEISTTEFGAPEPYRRDRNLDNEVMMIDKVKYPKGLALHSRTVLNYKLDGKYKIFEAVAGVDDSVESDSKVTLTIEGDLKPIFTGVIKKGDKPKVLNLAVLNVKELRITVESDLFDLGNQVSLGAAKVRK